MSQTLQYLNFSALAYGEYVVGIGGDKNKTIGEILNYGRQGLTTKDLNEKPELAALKNESNPLRDWILVDFEKDPVTGFAAAAFKNPMTGEIVFSFRGSDDPNDWVMSNAAILRPDTMMAQFEDAENFVFKVLNATGASYSTRQDMYNAISASSNVSFTGHSLGGALAQYMTYKTADLDINDIGAKSVTFNAPGITHLLSQTPISSEDRVRYNSTDHVNEFDLTGNFPPLSQLGSTVTHTGMLVDYSKVDFDSLSRMIYAKYQNVFHELTKIELTIRLNELKTSIVSNGYHKADTMAVYNGYFNSQAGGHHDLGSLVDLDTGEVTALQSAVRPYASVLKLTAMFQFINALEVIDTAKNTDFNYTSDAVNIPPVIDTYLLDGIYYFRKNSPTANPGDTYTHDQIAYANSIVNKHLRSVQDGKLAQPVIELQRAIAGNIRNIDPLVFDLDGDGIETTTLDGSNAFFDLDNNGLAENTSWVGKDDGLLALDRNNNGIIDNANELFGDQTLLNDGISYASSGFAALGEYDANQDYKIDSNDAIFSLLRIWQDLDGDGVADAGELKTLAQIGIVSIGLTYLNTGIADGSNNIQVRVGDFTWTDGTTGVVGEYLFQRNTRNSIEESMTNIPQDIAELPNIQGAGEVVSLSKAMTDDTSGQLKGLVMQFVAEQNSETRKNIFQQILYKWSGVDSVNPASRGGMFDARKLAAMEQFYGMEFTGNPVNWDAVALLEGSFTKLYNTLYLDLMSETHLSSLLNLVQESNGELTYDAVASEIDAILAVNSAKGTDLYAEFSNLVYSYGLQNSDGFIRFRNYYDTQGQLNFQPFWYKLIQGTSVADALYTDEGYRVIDGGDGDDSIRGNTIRDLILRGGNGNDMIDGSYGNDTLNGGAGDDRIWGSNGNDLLNGGAGSDHLDGGVGKDTYIFKSGDGHDTVYDEDGGKIIFGASITPSDVKITKLGGSIDHNWYRIDFLNSPNDSINIGSSPLSLQFYDGTVWMPSDFASRAVLDSTDGTIGDDIVWGHNNVNNTIHGFAGNDELHGMNGDDALYGDIGDDTLYGGVGNDTLDGGSGNDWLYGNGGHNTYKFGRGDGQDVISAEWRDSWDQSPRSTTVALRDGVLTTDVSLRKIYGQLVVYIKDTGDTLTLQGDENDLGEVKITFADGTMWGSTEIEQQLALPIELNGTNGNDVINTPSGVQGNVVFNGGAGDDILNGSSNSDTYIFGRGYGFDTINDQGGSQSAWQPKTDRIQFLAGIDPNDIGVYKIGSDLYLILTDSTSDGIKITDYYLQNGDGRPRRIEFVEFANGSTWTSIELEKRAAIFSTPTNIVDGTNGDDMLLGSSSLGDILRGFEGNDVIDGLDFDDTLDGGTGNDVLNGGGGHNTYVLGRGYGNDRIALSDVANNQFEYSMTVALAQGIEPTDLVFFRPNATDVAIGVLDANGNPDASLVIEDFYSPARGTKTITFADGTVWDETTILSHIDAIVTVTGTSGDDQIDGGYSNVVFDGGAGNDTLQGGNGLNVYAFGRGYGHDVINDDSTGDTRNSNDYIRLLPGVSQSDVEAYRTAGSNDLVLKIAGAPDDSLTIKNYYMENSDGTHPHRIEHIQFATGTSWLWTELESRVIILPASANIITGTSGNDQLAGTVASDIINAGDGNDQIIGMEGDDILNGGLGDDMYGYMSGGGHETIHDDGGSDSLLFLGGNPMNLIFERTVDDLRIAIAGEDGSVTVGNWYAGTNDQIESIQITDMNGVQQASLSNIQIDQLIQAMATFSVNNNGMTWAQALQSNPNDVANVLAQHWTVPTS